MSCRRTVAIELRCVVTFGSYPRIVWVGNPRATNAQASKTREQLLTPFDRSR